MRIYIKNTYKNMIKVHKVPNKKVQIQRKKAYSLIEMLVTLVITSIIMMGLISLLATILKISAMSHNRSKTREDLVNFSLEFEKDLRNASKVGICEGNEENFVCEIYTNALYRWTSCPREEPDFCKQGTVCDTKGVEVTMCKYLIDNDGNTIGEPLLKFDNTYNLEKFGVVMIAQDKLSDQQSDQENSNKEFTTKKIMSFTAIVSHPNSRYKINNIVRQSFISTKNFETILKKQE